jgi:hypothetical protein
VRSKNETVKSDAYDMDRGVFVQPLEFRL